MPYSKDISDFQKWIDGIFNSTNIVEFESCHDKPVKIVFEGEKSKKVNLFEVQSVLSNHNKNAFTVVWMDGTVTTVHCQDGDDWDDEKALAMCYTKKALGNKGNFNDKFNDALENKMKIINKKEVPMPAPKKAECAGLREEGIKSCKECYNDECEQTVYSVYLQGNRDSTFIACGTKDAIATTIRGYIHSHYPETIGTPQRVWNCDSGMFIDFGISKYIYIRDMTVEKWLGVDYDE